jgi:hypothetical protein
LVPGSLERLVHEVVGVVERSEHPVAVHVQLAPVTLEPGDDGGFVGE